MTKDEYCFNVCKAKCCYSPHGNKCPHLAADNKCSVYHERFTLGMPVKWKSAEGYKAGKPRLRVLQCSGIEELIKTKALPPAIRAQCVYVHPELAEQ